MINFTRARWSLQILACKDLRFLREALRTYAQGNAGKRLARLDGAAPRMEAIRRRRPRLG
jgi:hypothetical protein